LCAGTHILLIFFLTKCVYIFEGETPLFGTPDAGPF